MATANAHLTAAADFLRRSGVWQESAHRVPSPTVGYRYLRPSEKLAQPDAVTGSGVATGPSSSCCASACRWASSRRSTPTMSWSTASEPSCESTAAASVSDALRFPQPSTS